MQRFRDAIADHVIHSNELVGAMNSTAAKRHKAPEAMEKWEESTRRWHTHTCLVTEMSESAWRSPVYDDPMLLEFVFTFLEDDPWFLRSGYLKQRMLNGLKRTDLSKKNRLRMQAVILDSTGRRGDMLDKWYRRLAAVLADEPLVRRLRLQEQSGPDWSRRRVRRMLLAIARHGQPGLVDETSLFALFEAEKKDKSFYGWRWRKHVEAWQAHLGRTRD